MAGFPTGIPGQPGIGGGGPPMTVPGVTQPPSILPPQQVMSAVAKRPESALTLMKQVMVLLEKIAEIDPRQRPRINYFAVRPSPAANRISDMADEVVVEPVPPVEPVAPLAVPAEPIKPVE